MKKILLSVAAIILTLGVPAQIKKESFVKKIKASQSITALVINDDVQVILMNKDSGEIFIEGHPAVVEKVILTEKNGQLTIGSTAFFSRPVVVCVPANFISRVQVNGNSKIVSYQILPLTKLDIIVNGFCNLYIKTVGKVNVTALQDYSFTSKTGPVKS